MSKGLKYEINDHCKDSSNYCFRLCGSILSVINKHKKSGDGKNHYLCMCDYVNVSLYLRLYEW